MRKVVCNSSPPVSASLRSNRNSSRRLRFCGPHSPEAIAEAGNTCMAAMRWRCEEVAPARKAPHVHLTRAMYAAESSTVRQKADTLSIAEATRAVAATRLEHPDIRASRGVTTPRRRNAHAHAREKVKLANEARARGVSCLNDCQRGATADAPAADAGVRL